MVLYLVNNMGGNTLQTLGVLVILVGGAFAGYSSYQAVFDGYLVELHWRGSHTSWAVYKANIDRYSLLLTFDIQYVSFSSLKDYVVRTGAGLNCDTETKVIWSYLDTARGKVEIRIYKHNDLNGMISYFTDILNVEY